MNKEILQNYNTKLSENNNSLDEILEKVNDLKPIEGTLEITTNGEHDVKNYATASVNVLGDHSTEDDFMSGKSTEYSNNRITEFGVRALIGNTRITSVSSESVTTVKELAFGSCENLLTANFPALTRIEVSGFYRCKKLTKADFPLLTYLGGYAFDYCESLVSVNFPLVSETNNSVFDYCTSLVKADFGVLTRIYGGFFYNCQSLTTLILRSPTFCSLATTSALYNTPIAKGTGYIYVPDNLIETYKADSTWSTYSAQFKPLSEYVE